LKAPYFSVRQNIPVRWRIWFVGWYCVFYCFASCKCIVFKAYYKTDFKRVKIVTLILFVHF